MRGSQESDRPADDDRVLVLRSLIAQLDQLVAQLTALIAELGKLIRS